MGSVERKLSILDAYTQIPKIIGVMSIAREEVKYASKDYVSYLLDKQEYHNEKYTEYDIKQAFEKGAEWADNHPINVLHNANEKNQIIIALLLSLLQRIKMNAMPTNKT